MHTESVQKVVLVSPVSEANPAEFVFAPRLPDLRGKRVGLLDNSKSKAGRLLDMLARRLQDQYDFSEIIIRRKPSASKPADPMLIEEFARTCDLVIVGVGD